MSDVIVLSEAIPDTAAVVHRLMPIITRSQHSQRAMVTAVDAGPPTSQEGNQNHNCNARPPTPRRVIPFFAGRYSHPGTNGSVSAPSSVTMNGTRCFISPEM